MIAADTSRRVECAPAYRLRCLLGPSSGCIECPRDMLAVPRGLPTGLGRDGSLVPAHNERNRNPNAIQTTCTRADVDCRRLNLWVGRVGYRCDAAPGSRALREA